MDIHDAPWRKVNTVVNTIVLLIMTHTLDLYTRLRACTHNDAGLAIIAPNVPTLMTNFMASRREGGPMVCEDYPPSAQPQSCQNAYSDVVFWSSASSFVSNSLLTFIMVRLGAYEGHFTSSFARAVHALGVC